MQAGLYVNERAIVVHHHLFKDKVAGVKSEGEAGERVRSIVRRMAAHHAADAAGPAERPQEEGPFFEFDHPDRSVETLALWGQIRRARALRTLPSRCAWSRPGCWARSANWTTWACSPTCWLLRASPTSTPRSAGPCCGRAVGRHQTAVGTECRNRSAEHRTICGSCVDHSHGCHVRRFLSLSGAGNKGGGNNGDRHQVSAEQATSTACNHPVCPDLAPVTFS